MMRVTIRSQLFGLIGAGLIFVAAVSATGYWGVTTLRQATANVAAIGEAIRNHVEAGNSNDQTRRDITAVFTEKGDDQRSAAEELKQHEQMLQVRIEAARKLVIDDKSRAMLNEEAQLSDRYVQAGNALLDALLNHPANAPALMPPYLQLYGELRGKIEDANDQLAKSAKEAEAGAETRASRATKGILAICGASLVILFTGSVLLAHLISKSLAQLIHMIRDVAEGEGDVTKRLQTAGSLGTNELGEVSRLFNVFMDKLQDILRGIVLETHKLTEASEQVLAASDLITSNSEVTSTQSNSASRATQQITENLNSLSMGAGEMTSTIQSIASNAQDAAKVAASAVSAAQAANTTIGKLGHSGAEIGAVIKMITSIAEQTNLLALNATIEAARAGQAGKGFAVVANEVKELAKQTAQATEEIGKKILGIQDDTKEAVTTIGTVSDVINHINEISATIAAAVEEQGATTSEMTRNAGEAATGARNISVSIGGVAQAADSTLSRARESQKAAQELASVSSELSRLIRQFKIERSEPRLDVVLPVRIRMTDASGAALYEELMTVNISAHGAHLKGLRGKARVGARVMLLRGNKSEEFTVAWVRKGSGVSGAEIGVSTSEGASSFWREELETQHQPELVGV